MACASQRGGRLPLIVLAAPAAFRTATHPASASPRFPPAAVPPPAALPEIRRGPAPCHTHPWHAPRILPIPDISPTSPRPLPDLSPNPRSPHRITPETTPVSQIQQTDDLTLLLDVLPPPVHTALTHHPDRDDLIEIVLDLGRPPEARFPERGVFLAEAPITGDDLRYVVERVGRFGADNRAGIERTLHRISAIRNRAGETVGLTCRVGRAVFGTLDIVRDVVERGSSLLLLGRPGVGKTTLLREAARVLADDLGKRVVVVDTSNEIAGDGDIPHPGIGRARRMQVATPASQAGVMIEAVENHMPEVIVIDEIGTQEEAAAARTIAERGVQLIATAHGNTLENLLQNPTLSDLVGGIQAVTLSDEEARRRRTQKTVLERKAPPTFDVLIEIQSKDALAVHHRVAEVVDRLLRGVAPRPELRTRTGDGDVEIQAPDAGDDGRAEAAAFSGSGRGGRGGAAWGDAGRSEATSNGEAPRRAREGGVASSHAGADDRPRGEPRRQGAPRAKHDGGERRSARWPGAAVDDVAPGRASRILRVFPYAVSRSRLERAVRKFGVPAYVVQDLAQADVILTTKSQERRQPRKLRDAQARGVPLHLIKSNTVTQMESFLRHAFHLDRGDGDEADALSEVETAIEEVRAGNHPVELAPRNSYLRRLQHELAERHRLGSESRGDEPQRRVVLYPPA